jgi:hypothetical protein
MSFIVFSGELVVRVTVFDGLWPGSVHHSLYSLHPGIVFLLFLGLAASESQILLECKIENKF